MNQGSLLNPPDYTMVASVKKGKREITTNVSFTLMSPSNNSVILMFSPAQKFAQGGAITVNNPASGGILSSAGVKLSSSYILTILSKAKRIVLGA
jgi:hypothetical protein